MEVTYDSIKSLIVSQEPDGQMIKIKFKANNQDTPLETVAVVQMDPKELMKNVMKQTGKAMVANSAIKGATGAIGAAVGGGVGGAVADEAGRVAAGAVSQNLFDADKIMKQDITDEKIQKAIATAFSYLTMYYKHNGTEWEYITPTAG
jgi:uncharacterized protein YcfJ